MWYPVMEDREIWYGIHQTHDTSIQWMLPRAQDNHDSFQPPHINVLLVQWNLSIYIATTFGPQKCDLNREVVSLRRSKTIVQALLGHNQVVFYKEVVVKTDNDNYCDLYLLPVDPIVSVTDWSKQFLTLMSRPSAYSQSMTGLLLLPWLLVSLLRQHMATASLTCQRVWAVKTSERIEEFEALYRKGKTKLSIHVPEFTVEPELLYRI